MPLPNFNVELLELIYNHAWVTDEERMLLELIYKKNMDNWRIGQELHCSEATVRRKRKKMYSRIEPIVIEYYKNKK